jgi:hypothetical protein
MHVSDLPVLRALLCRASRLAASFCSYPFGYRRLRWMLFSFSTLSAASNDLGLLLSDVLRRYSVWCTGGCRLFPLTEDVWNVMNSIINRIPETKSRLEIIRTSVCPSPFPLCKAMTNSPLDPVDAMTQFRRQEPFRCKQKIRKRLGACHPKCSMPVLSNAVVSLVTATGGFVFRTQSNIWVRNSGTFRLELAKNASWNDAPFFDSPSIPHRL